MGGKFFDHVSESANTWGGGGGEEACAMLVSMSRGGFLSASCCSSGDISSVWSPRLPVVSSSPGRFLVLAVVMVVLVVVVVVVVGSVRVLLGDLQAHSGT